MAAPTNTTLATATPLASLPADVTQNVHDSGTTYTVWYTFTVPAGVTVIGAFAFGDLTVYTPILEAPYNAAGTFPTSGQVVATNKPTQFAVTPSTQVWMRIRANSGNPSPASLRLQVEAAPSAAVPVGAIVVPDDAPARPAALLDPTTGEVLRFISPFPSGEQGDVLANGTMLVSDEFDDLDLKLYNAQFARLMDVPVTWTGISPTIRTNHGSQTFYVGSPGSGGTPAEVTTVAGDGTPGPTVWVLPEVGLRAAAASNDDTVLYHSGQATGGSAIRRWNLTTDAAMADLVATVADHSVTDILVLSDDTLIVSYFKGSAPQDLVALHYSAAGATLHTYPFGSNHTSTTPRLAYARDDPASFWIWTHPDTPAGFSLITNVRVSDGTILTTLTVAEFEGGISQPAASATPDARFGISFSCPFFVTRVALDVPPDEEQPPYVAPSYHLDARYIRRLRRAPHVENEHKRVFFRSFELDLERGQGLASGQGSDPIVLLRLSRDGGQTWGEEVRMHAGALGAYTQRCLARRLGQARDTVFEVTVSDPIAWSLVGAWLDLEPGAH